MAAEVATLPRRAIAHRTEAAAVVEAVAAVEKHCSLDFLPAAPEGTLLCNLEIPRPGIDQWGFERAAAGVVVVAAAA